MTTIFLFFFFSLCVGHTTIFAPHNSWSPRQLLTTTVSHHDSCSCQSGKHVRYGEDLPGAGSIWAGCTGCKVDLGRVHRVQCPWCLMHPGAIPFMPYTFGCNALPSCLVHPGAWMRENTYMLLPRAHMIKVVCVCVHDRSTYFLLRKGLSVCPFAIWIWWILRCRYFRVHTGPGKPGKGVNFLKSQGKSPGNFENSKKVLEKVLGNIFLVLKKNYSIFFS